MSDWQRIPAPIESEADRRELAAILTACGLEIRIVRERPTKSGADAPPKEGNVLCCLKIGNIPKIAQKLKSNVMGKWGVFTQ